MMTRIPSNPVQVFRVFPFESCISIAMILVGLGSVFGEVSAAGSMSEALAEALLMVWELCIIVGGVGVLAALFLRPWAARRLPPVRAQRTLATLRGTQAVGCVLVATGALTYAMVLLAQGGIRLDGRSFTVAAMLAITAGYVMRAWDLIDTNRRVLRALRELNASRP